ncbi:D-isomer specific 2-hydroxyacid dehydrogenase family protein [Curtobacterium sp. MCBD17_030]|uniref:NAD(P)-dependent oxidoreductase n=1 Tax=Curtobacterium sp. MCBD17_030 TaxID=2175649 RepID=UPI000D849982|nr:NAD(P)-dependent oxidoreductase [Curtobacterium sp. MCBD17_030]PYY36426.1 hypothetical protein DEI89_04450 [Curtobacterium sp. MCBD17_030]
MSNPSASREQLTVAFGRPGTASSPVGQLIRQMEPDWLLTDTSSAPLAVLASTADVVCPVHEPVDQAMLEGTSVRFVQLLGVGTDGIDLQGLRALGIPVANIPSRESGNADAVAELAIAFTITLVRRVDASRSDAREGRLTPSFAPSLMGRRILLVGLGDVGSALASRLAAFRVHVTAIRSDPTKGSPAGVDMVFGPDALIDAMGTTDVVILCAPPSDEPVLGRTALRAMKPGGYVVNVGRGSLIDEPALLDALEEGIIAGAALDVMDEEPPRRGHPLVAHPSVIVTPHVAGAALDVGIASARLFVENIRRLATPDGPHWVRN